MASNGSTSVSVTAYDTLKFSWVQVGQSTANNNTVINWTLQLISGSAGKIISSASKSWSVTINGVTTPGTNSVAIENNTTKTLASGQATIAHNSDGTKSFSYSFSQEFGITFAGVSVGTKTGSGTGVLNTIPRATTPVLNVTTADIGSTVTIYTSRASSSFTHDLSYSFAGGAYVSIATGVETYMYWAVPSTLSSSIPNTTSGTLTIKCITKNGTTVVGESTTLLTVKVPATVVPTISAVTPTEANTGTITTIGAYVQGQSKLKVTVAAAGASGSTIKSYSSTFQGKTYTGSSFTTDTVTSGGTLNIVTTVTDSRGRTATKTTAVTVLAYEPPKITKFFAGRYDDKGVADPNGIYARVTIWYTVTPLNDKNTAKALIQYKQSTSSTWLTLYTLTQLSRNHYYSPVNTTFSTDYQWDFKVTLTDAFNSEATYSTYIPSGAVILDIKADGKGISFFKTSTKNGVDIDGALPDSPISLTSSANLNNLTTPGFYVIPTTEISATVTNKPYTDTATASIRVERTGETTVKQILQKSTKDNGMIYERGYENSSGWGSWSVVYGGAGKLLWTGNYLLTAAQSLTFSEPMSQQQNGVVLVFSRYDSSGVQNYAYSCHFIPKMILTAVGATSANMNLIMGTAGFEYLSGKSFTISDTGITGNATNNASGTSTISGITYNNGMFALRYVIGV